MTVDMILEAVYNRFDPSLLGIKVSWLNILIRQEGLGKFQELGLNENAKIDLSQKAKYSQSVSFVRVALCYRTVKTSYVIQYLAPSVHLSSQTLPILVSPL